MVLKPVIAQSKPRTVDQDAPWYAGRERLTHQKMLHYNKRNEECTYMADYGTRWETTIKVTLNVGSYVRERIWILSLTPNYVKRLSEHAVTGL